MSTIGTAGHVDHGKSTLVKVLTGIDPDRLTEEKERGMTIDLGFAWLQLPSGREVSIVDVPGHESFIKNMLAGVGGIDAALLVIAADEGIMPQTREHLAILDLLRVQRGVVALTKADLVDEEWLDLVREEIIEQLAPTTLAGSPIVPVSAYTGQGLPALLQELDTLLAEAQERQNILRPRLPIDRVFTMTGFGTVVTGTLLDGSLKVGQELEILPQGVHARIRTLQTHRHSVDVALPGSRVAINLAGIARSDLVRGNVVALPAQLRPTLLVDVRLHLLSDAARLLAHNTLVDFYSGSQEIPARVRLLDVEELQPGQSAMAQIRFSRPAVVARRDRFILRIPSPSATIGGGEILDVQPRYHRRFQAGILNTLATLERGTPEELVLAALEKSGTGGTSLRAQTSGQGSGMRKGQGSRSSGVPRTQELAEIAKQSNLPIEVTQRTLETLLTEGRVQQIGTAWMTHTAWEGLLEEAVHIVREQHRQYPLRSGLSKEEWRTRLNLPPKLAADLFTLLQTEERLSLAMSAAAPAGEATARSQPGGIIRLTSFVPTLSTTQRQQVEQLLRRFHQNPYTPPDRAEAEALVGSEVLAVLLDQGQLIKVGESILFLRETYDEAKAKLLAHLHVHGTITVAEARDLLGATRKYILPLLEHWDALKITRRIGDERILQKQ